MAATFGVVAPIVTFTCIGLAIWSWPQFSWTNNALSDLGVQSGVTAWLFNGGLIAGAILFMVFATGLFTFTKHPLGKIAAATFMLAIASLFAVGVFNENFSPTHYTVSVMLFVFLPISLLMFVSNFWLEGKRGLSGFTLGLGLVAAAVWILQLTLEYVPKVAIPEIISGVAGAAWVLAVSYLMLKKDRSL
jgi:hypothetical membrane protein